MILSTLDWWIIGAYFAGTLLIGLWVSRRAEFGRIFPGRAEHALVVAGRLDGRHDFFDRHA